MKLLSSNVYLICLLIISILILIISLFILISPKSNKQDEYYTIMSDSLDKCEDILYDDFVANWEYDGTQLGKGKNATVYGGYGIIDGKRINVAIKVIDYVNRDRFLKEVLFQIQASTSNIAPVVYDAFMCGNTGYLVTSKIKFTIKDYLETFKKGSKEQMDMFEALKEKAKELLIISNDISLLHTDRHIDNFGVVTDELGIPSLVLIDWDAAKGVKLSNSGMDDVLNKLDQTFQLLKTNLLAPSSMHKYKVPEGPSKKRIPQPRTEVKPKQSISISTFSEPRPQTHTSINNSNSISTNDIIPSLMPSLIPSSNQPSPIRFSSFGSIEDNELSPFSTPVKNRNKEEEEEKKYESPFKIRKVNRYLFDEDN